MNDQPTPTRAMAFFAISRSDPLRLLSTTDLVRENDKLNDERTHLHRAVSSHATVDQAIGALLVLGQTGPEDSWDVLRETSQHTNRKLHLVAEDILAFARGGTLPDDIRVALEAALSKRQPGKADAPSAESEMGPGQAETDPGVADRDGADPGGATRAAHRHEPSST
ncbi:ANTAR domain-containing protein [Streptomyces sp. NPDC005548]|uniref:ANTAR domain-containing protein n=1 Tax=Streptomyces sp. NPDC005548 TaxID=3364724 RepID=UPI0036ADE6EE